MLPSLDGGADSGIPAGPARSACGLYLTTPPPGSNPRRTYGVTTKLTKTAPAGTLDADSVILLDEDAEIELQDGSWVYARVGAQCRDLDGRWHLHLCWYATSPLTGQGHWFVYHPAHIRRAPGHETPGRGGRA